MKDLVELILPEVIEDSILVASQAGLDFVDLSGLELMSSNFFVHEVANDPDSKRSNVYFIRVFI